ncbi:MFS transporter, DHA1 family, bicyclomycin/chloramphenicol resistance protein [Amphiplicatus metriothermophilus]|uniref:MFS transporter, DHA1 family, bicyclomycin/chloramphenicol resistance protein n=2 Tax=Amphiplicatus metriothermophilus TaxID=1519374 RepID=A0A239PKX4_9PROT|nr:MFS transporter, DHA1 family, bicyclomycin/chloramphenicol resistance protein [Amphiplicatus metriothermophilus]
MRDMEPLRDGEALGDGPGDASLSPPLRFAELVAIVAAVMALNALAIDMMLPALGLIGEELGTARDNDRQLIVVVYIIGNGLAQLIFGPFVDRFGRRRVLLWALAGYVVGCLLSVVASSFSLLLAARAFQGVATAASRVAAIALVRDLASGRRMAEVMSLAITVFMAAPILAPGFGQLILFAAPWRGIFIALMLYGLVLCAWFWARLPETLTTENVRPLKFDRIGAGYLEFVRNRTAMGYTLVAALAFGALFGYISASEQIFLETFDLGARFPMAFAMIAGALGAATLLNARLVGRFGMRRLCHGAILFFVLANLIHLFIVAAGYENLTMFLLFTSLSFFALGLIGPNCTAMALEPMGHIAGAASAANGFAGTTLAGFLGGVIGRFYDGTTTPIIMGFVCLGLAALALALWVEKGRLFEPHEGP